MREWDKQEKKDKNTCCVLVTIVGNWGSSHRELWLFRIYLKIIPKWLRKPEYLFIISHWLTLWSFWLSLCQASTQFSGQRTFLDRDPGSHQHELELSVNMLLDLLKGYKCDTNRVCYESSSGFSSSSYPMNTGLNRIPWSLPTVVILTGTFHSLV